MGEELVVTQAEKKHQETQPEVWANVSMGPKHPFCTQAPLYL